MCHSRTSNRKWTGSTKDAQGRIVFNGKLSSFKELLVKGSCDSIHERNVQILPAEASKVSNNFSLPQMNENFKLRNEHFYNLSQNSHFSHF